MIKSSRLWVMWVAAAAVVAWYWRTDPDGGAETLARVQWMAWLVVVAGPVYLLRRALMDDARSRAAYRRALDTPTGAGLVFIGLALLTGLLFLAASARAAALPVGAVQNLPVLSDEIAARWPRMPMPSVLGALVEQESGWKQTARLKTSREEGIGLGQFTRAWRADGTLRFDALAETRTMDASLSGWSWNDPYNVRYQLRAVVVKNRACYLKLRTLLDDDYNALAMCDAAYNGGLSGVYAERRLCAQVDGCNPDHWFGNVELHSIKSRVKWHGYGASAFDINRGHVRAVMVTRRPRYAAWFGEAT